jgi:hypothetical protein
MSILSLLNVHFGEGRCPVSHASASLCVRLFNLSDDSSGNTTNQVVMRSSRVNSEKDLYLGGNKTSNGSTIK